WGWGRGQAYVTLMYAKMLEDEYEVFVLKQGTNPIADEFEEVNAIITEYPKYNVEKKVFKEWIRENDLDAVVFNEYNQWTIDEQNLVKVAKEMGVKVYGYLVTEKFKPGQEKDYDRIWAPTMSFVRNMRKNKVRKFTYIPYSIDLNEFEVKDVKNTKFTFFHQGGWGGVHSRKNTRQVIEAFKALDKPDTRLVITSQISIDMELPENIIILNKEHTRKEMIDYFKSADAFVQPSKWETIGIPILEAMASGLPVITCDIPPMNEFVRPGINGYLANGTMKDYPGISIQGMDVDILDLKAKMETMLNPTIYSMLTKNSRAVVEKIYDLEKNKKYLLEFLKEDLK
ncbi:glycosyltransferase family 4 protein, partial [Oceanihabitans sediminis]|uniref:glycosyltransferase family 4 protein n=1 Tax=Oceanihabitans sediminis TaxID=1812012 RepID=UPI00299E6FA8